MSSLALATGVRLALPVVAVLFMVQIALGFISRAAPSMQIFSIGFAALLITGGVVLVMALPDIGRELIADFSHVGDRIETVVSDVSRH
jgi:flagellar biosynthetic protein FliR